MELKNNDFFTLRLINIEDGKTNIFIDVDNFRYKLNFDIRSYNRKFKLEKRSTFIKKQKKKISLKKLNKLKNDLKNLKKISEIKKYFEKNNIVKD